METTADPIGSLASSFGKVSLRDVSPKHGFRVPELDSADVVERLSECVNDTCMDDIPTTAKAGICENLAVPTTSTISQDTDQIVDNHAIDSELSHPHIVSVRHDGQRESASSIAIELSVTLFYAGILCIMLYLPDSIIVNVQPSWFAIELSVVCVAFVTVRQVWSLYVMFVFITRRKGYFSPPLTHINSLQQMKRLRTGKGTSRIEQRYLTISGIATRWKRFLVWMLIISANFVLLILCCSSLLAASDKTWRQVSASPWSSIEPELSSLFRATCSAKYSGGDIKTK